MFGNSPFNVPISQEVLKSLSAESKVFEQQGQGGGQGSQGYGPCEDNNPSNSDINEEYSDSTNEFYLYTIDNGWGDEVQVVQWQGSTPTEAIKRQYLAYLRYTNRVNRNALQGGCVPQAQANYANPGFQVLFPNGSSGLWGDKTDRNQGTGVRVYEQTWKDAKAQHEGAFAGCMSSTASNYNSNAASDDGSCVWTFGEVSNFDDWNWGGRPQTDKTADKFRYKWEMTSVEEKLGYTQADTRLRGTWRIYKECFDKSDCGVPSTENDVAKRTLPITTIQTGQIGYPNGLAWNDFTTAKGDAKAAGQTAIDALFTNHVAIDCRDSSPLEQFVGSYSPCDNSFSLEIARSIIFCDGDINRWKRAIYTLEQDGVLQGSWEVTNDANYSLSLSGQKENNAVWQQHMIEDKGNYSWVQAAQDIVDAHEATLENPPITEEYAINSGFSRPRISSTGVVDDTQRTFWLRWGSKQIITNTCSTNPRQEIVGVYLSAYSYTAKESIVNLVGIWSKPSVDYATDSDGNITMVVRMDGETLTPSETFDIKGMSNDERSAIYNAYLPKIGCMDMTATNYDPEANNNSKQMAGSSSACVWDCVEGDGRNLNNTCKSCLPEYEMTWNTETQTWNCIGIPVDDIIEGVNDATDTTMLMIAGAIGLMAVVFLG